MDNAENFIGVFDSGVGGLTVLKEILKLLPNENIIYFSDAGNSPYGEKSEKEIQTLCLNILDFLLDKKCKAIVIACNTATVAAIDIIREKTSVPIIGVIAGGVEEALRATKNKKIGILGTDFTVNSNAYKKELLVHDSNLEIFQSACTKFCPMIENGWENFEERFSVIEKYISIIPKDVDTLILGCSHYPLIENDIRKFFTKNIINPAKKTVLNLEKILCEKNILGENNNNSEIKFFTTGEVETFKNLAEKFLCMKNLKIEKIN
ncbi:MAG: glutamate racemase [Fusobacteriaceae bacterium]